MSQWTPDSVLELARAYQPMCILAAAAELEVFELLADASRTAGEIAGSRGVDARGMTILLDALAALGLLIKAGGTYRNAEGVSGTLTTTGKSSVLAMVQHQANCLRRWSELAEVIHRGQPAPRRPSVRGAEADYASFVEAMDNLARNIADKIVADIPRLDFSGVLDVGGASGSWTIAFLRAYPQASATLFDLPHVVPQARARLAESGVLDRVELIPGDFYADELPHGCDLAWVSAIVHQNSRQQNVELFHKLHRALPPRGRVLIRDILMEPSRTQPVMGALFAVNMLVGTPAGGTFTVAELAEDLAAAGFTDAQVVRRDEGMHSVLLARRGD